MKIRNHKKTEYWFYPHETSYLKKNVYIFKYKSDLIKFLNNNFKNCLGGIVKKQVYSFNRYDLSLRKWFVWYNNKPYKSGAELKIELRQINSEGKKYIYNCKIPKSSKKYYAFSDKLFSLMYNIKQEDGTILSKDAKRLVELFYKRGFKDFELDEEDLEYINYFIKKGVDFKYWSDRCNWQRTKTIIEYFKHKNLI